MNLRERARELAEEARRSVKLFASDGDRKALDDAIALAILAGMREALGEPDDGMFAVDAPPIERPGDFATMKYRRGIWTAMASKRLEGIE